jgi:hypothetical protein
MTIDLSAFRQLLLEVMVYGPTWDSWVCLQHLQWLEVASCRSHILLSFLTEQGHHACRACPGGRIFRVHVIETKTGRIRSSDES